MFRGFIRDKQARTQNRSWIGSSTDLNNNNMLYYFHYISFRCIVFTNEESNKVVFFSYLACVCGSETAQLCRHSWFHSECPNAVITLPVDQTHALSPACFGSYPTESVDRDNCAQICRRHLDHNNVLAWTEEQYCFVKRQSFNKAVTVIICLVRQR